MLINKRFSRTSIKLGNQSFTRAELLASSSRGKLNKLNILDKKRRNTDISGINKIRGMSDDFWQNQVQRLMQETKNYKQLHFEQKMEMKEILKQNTELKKKVKRFRKQKDELNQSLNEYRNSNESNYTKIILFRLNFNIRKSKHKQ